MGLRESRGLEEFFTENWESVKPNSTWAPNMPIIWRCTLQFQLLSSRSILRMTTQVFFLFPIMPAACAKRLNMAAISLLPLTNK